MTECKVLVVDVNDATWIDLRHTLSMRDWEIQRAKNYVEAWQLIQHHLPRLVLVSIPSAAASSRVFINQVRQASLSSPISLLTIPEDWPSLGDDARDKHLKEMEIVVRLALTSDEVTSLRLLKDA